MIKLGIRSEMMKKKLLFLLMCMLVISVISFSIASAVSKEENSDDKIKIVTSFYPIYNLTINIAEGVDNVEVVNLTSYESGCLHDYQLTTSDMKRLENADVFIMNGGGMEGFLDDVLEAYPNIDIVDSSRGIKLLEAAKDNHGHEDHEDHEDNEHSHHEYNAHIWMSMDNYIRQIENVKEDLSQLDPDNKTIYANNSNQYINEIKELQMEYEKRLSKYRDIPVIIFHDAFTYLAHEQELNVVYTVDMDENTYFSAGEISEIIDIINKYQVNILLTEAQYSESIAETIANESSSQVYIIDTVVTGGNSKEGYISAMSQNLDILERVYEENRSYYE